LGPELRAWLDDEGRLLTVESADSSAGGWGVAIDVGSTTLAVALVDLADGGVLASASALNPQAPFGADVISRIAWAQERPDGVGALHRALVRGIDALIAECVAAMAPLSEGARPIRSLAAVGNPTMLHTLLGADPASLGQAPYVGVWRGAWRGGARELGLDLPESSAAYLLPGVGSHVGADTVAAIVASGLDRAERPTLLVDLGTNSEVVLGCRDFILCASTSAGPAFEGAAIHQGMRAAPGAIEQVRIRRSGSVFVRVIGGEEARGICGSGLVDAAAELLRVGVLEPSGRMRSLQELERFAPAALLERFLDDPAIGRAIRLAGSAERPVLFTASDVRQLQLVKGSIAAGMRVLLDRKGICLGDVGEVLVAGAFGNYLRARLAQAIGLVPPVDPERVRFVGNAAGAGARAVLCDCGYRRRAQEVASRAQYLELADAAEYAERFALSMAFPEVPA
ncbi:MAG TPA: ASKHA domain-containing protein, partial [Longimicrobiales bacterium]